MHFRLKLISILSSLMLRSRYLVLIALELLIETTPRRSSLLNTLLVLRDRLVAISSMEFPASNDSTSWFSSDWLHRLLAMTGWGFRASWYSASESFSIAKRNASWVSGKKIRLLECQESFFGFGIVHTNLFRLDADYYIFISLEQRCIFFWRLLFSSLQKSQV